MSINEITIVTVSYNASHLLKQMLSSLRHFYKNKVLVVDGSDDDHLPSIREVALTIDNVELHAMGYNIHHGPGMAWAIQKLGLKGRVLFLDTDIVVLKAGFIEELNEVLRTNDYGVGGIGYVNRDGFDISYGYGAVPYLHPPCMLCNIEVMKQWPMPIKHGAPMIAPMLALHDAGRSGLIRNLEWTRNDILMGTRKVYIDHIGKGTSNSTGGYHLEEWMAEVQAKRVGKTVQPPSQGYNPDLLALIPANAKALIEVGCSTGSLAYALKSRQPHAHYLGIELDPIAAEIASHHCDGMVSLDIEGADESLYRDYADRDCWIFGDVLEHLRDPWRVLKLINQVLPKGGCVVASLPNVQHWSVQGRLAVGDFRYEGTGLLDRTHLRWFTRVTLHELFNSAGFTIEAGVPRIFNEPGREPVLGAIRQMAIAMGRDPEGAVRDALPLQYVVRAVKTEELEFL